MGLFGAIGGAIKSVVSTGVKIVKSIISSTPKSPPTVPMPFPERPPMPMPLPDMSSLLDNNSSDRSERRQEYYQPQPTYQQPTVVYEGLKDEERIRLMKEAQLEIINAQKESQIAIEEARVRGLDAIAAQLVALQDKMLDVAQKRLMIIEEGSMPIVREIEAFYNEVGQRIEADNDDYNMKKLPQLLEILERYDEGTSQHRIYATQIGNDIERHNQFISQQLEQVLARQNMVMQSFLSSKERIIEQTGELTRAIALKSISRQLEGLKPVHNDIGNGSVGGANQIGGRDNQLLPANSGAH